jgi:hypothetical protein
MIHIGSFLHMPDDDEAAVLRIMMGGGKTRTYSRPYVPVEFDIYLGQYANGNVAVLLTQSLSGPPLATMSINVRPLTPGEFVLHHDMNARLLEEVMVPRSELASLVVLFEDTGRTVDYGHVRGQPVWRVFDYAHRINTVWKKEE